MTEAECSTNITHEKCHAHQNNRAAKYASGTGGFVSNANLDLSRVLEKSHGILTRILRSTHQMKVLHNVQETNERKRIRNPQPGVVTRWNSEVAKVHSANIIMGDLNKVLVAMLVIDGVDEKLLTDAFGNPVDRKELIYIPSDQTIM